MQIECNCGIATVFDRCKVVIEITFAALCQVNIFCGFCVFICQKECHKFCQKACHKICQKECQKIC